MEDDRPEWDAKSAEALVGARVLVGLTYVGPAGERVEQFVGTVAEVDPRIGVTLSLEGSRAGETYTLPPDTRALFPAPKGSYRLRQTGEVVVDPDYTTKWRVQEPSN